MLDVDYLIYLCLAGVGIGCYRAFRRMRPHMDAMRASAEAGDEETRARLRGTIIGSTIGGVAGGVVFGLIAGSVVWVVASSVIAAFR